MNERVEAIQVPSADSKPMFLIIITAESLKLAAHLFKCPVTYKLIDMTKSNEVKELNVKRWI